MSETQPKMRPLIEEEKDLTTKTLARTKEDLEWYTALEEQINFDLDKMIDIEARQRKKQCKTKLSNVRAAIEQSEFAVKVAEEQLEKGVVIPEKPEVEELIGEPVEGSVPEPTAEEE